MCSSFFSKLIFAEEIKGDTVKNPSWMKTFTQIFDIANVSYKNCYREALGLGTNSDFHERIEACWEEYFFMSFFNICSEKNLSTMVYNKISNFKEGKKDEAVSEIDLDQIVIQMPENNEGTEDDNNKQAKKFSDNLLTLIDEVNKDQPDFLHIHVKDLKGVRFHLDQDFLPQAQGFIDNLRVQIMNYKDQSDSLQIYIEGLENLIQEQVQAFIDVAYEVRDNPLIKSYYTEKEQLTYKANMDEWALEFKDHPICGDL